MTMSLPSPNASDRHGRISGMTPPRPFDPVMEAWIAEQMTHFGPRDLDEGVRVWRQIRHEKARAAARHINPMKDTH